MLLRPKGAIILSDSSAETWLLSVFVLVALEEPCLCCIEAKVASRFIPESPGSELPKFERSLADETLFSVGRQACCNGALWLGQKDSRHFSHSIFTIMIFSQRR